MAELQLLADGSSVGYARAGYSCSLANIEIIFAGRSCMTFYVGIIRTVCIEP